MEKTKVLAIIQCVTPNRKKPSEVTTINFMLRAAGSQSARSSRFLFHRSNQIILTFRPLFFMLYDCAIVVAKDRV